jgi:tetratricopeptide (TPR) repeat protein
MTSGESPNLENLLQLGIKSAKEGNRDSAKLMLQQVLDADKKNDRAWYWMAYIATDKSKRIQYLENALKANPRNQLAQRALKKISTKRSVQEQRLLVSGIVMVLVILIIATLLCLVAVVAN